MVSLNSSAVVHAKAFVKKPQTLVETLDKFWESVCQNFDGRLTDRWEFYADRSDPVDEYIRQLQQIIAGWDAATALCDRLSRVHNLYRGAVCGFVRTLSELRNESRAQTPEDGFPETIRMIDHVLKESSKTRRKRRNKDRDDRIRRESESGKFDQKALGARHKLSPGRISQIINAQV